MQTVFIRGRHSRFMIERARAEDKVGVEREGGDPVRVLLERVQRTSLGRVPHAHRAVIYELIYGVRPVT